MKDILIKYGNSIGIEKIGIADIGPYEDLEKILINREKKGHLTGLEDTNIKRRIDPKVSMEDAKSIIVCLFPYHVKQEKRSNISNYTYSKDYHLIAQKKLNLIGEYLNKHINDFKYHAHVDTGPLVDRYLGHRAGLGFYGINAHLINDDYGTYFFIGYILNNYPFEADNTMDRTCYQCMKCVYSCPGKIILGNFDINPLRCKSFITQKKRDIDQLDKDIIKKDNIVFGCDICQQVCPHNDGIEITHMEEFKEDLVYRLDYDEIKEMSNKGFKRKYGDRAFAWRGRKVIKRNYEIIHNIKTED
ncbi:tRNA epoxyqueuosine(34) reductase QueG [Clostridium sp. D2Q-11]|uniref:tRNA epoxyqueuosine(34) reductase QueG n=1 Tax=Anaeromonas frigoriresistens TaxID=2683708 RepID=A0A942UTW1_9FIRM|nr:tRNA epoxyqueuosine(34) reductase QueG [Anaeromonas frigoriresistens]MBS4539159.1 tRNA epoxyqueuosine(34) reductase QueG [Anaeromonas frigoriresistens]